mgnify:CR=1 FL=1
MTAKTVLIVDDEAPIREMIAVALEMADYRVLEADNAQAAHAIIVDDQPDLLLLDWMMPGTSGIELARRLKREETTAELPIILLTAKGEESDVVVGLALGVGCAVGGCHEPPHTASDILRWEHPLVRVKHD